MIGFNPLASTPIAGQGATITVEVRLSAGTGVFAVVGQLASLTLPGKIVAAAGVFDAAGQGVGLVTSRRLSAETGSTSLAGQSADLTSSPRLGAETGTFALAGQAAAVYPPLAGHRYWRLYITANNGNTDYTGINELELRDVRGGTDVTGGGTASAASINDSRFTADNAFDDDTGSDWITAFESPVPTWIEYDFGAGGNKEIVEVALLRAGNSFQLTQAPRDFDVQWSDDGTTWTTAWSVTGANSGGTLEVFSAPLGPGALGADAGSFAVAGQGTTLTATRQLAGEAGAYVAAGQGATTLRARAILSDTGSIVLSASAVVLDAGPKTLRAQAAALSLAGADTGLVRTVQLGGETGAVAVDAQGVAITAVRRLGVGGYAAVLVTAPANIAAQRRLSIDPVALELSGVGVDVGLEGFVSGDVGAFEIDTAAPAMQVVRTLAAERQDLTIVAETAPVLVSRRLDATPRDVDVTAVAAGLSRVYLLHTEAPRIVISGYGVRLLNPAASISRRRTAIVGAHEVDDAQKTSHNGGTVAPSQNTRRAV